MDNAEDLLRMKAAMVNTTGTPGWQYIKKFAETVLREMDRKAIDEEDDDKATGYRRDAKGARAHWNTLLQRIEIAKAIESEDGFVEVVDDCDAKQPQAAQQP